MRRTLIILFLLVAVNSSISFPQNLKKTKFVFLPPGLNFMPLRAGIDEARMGLLYYTANRNMKVDIGNSFDLLEFNLSNQENITIGAEFMAYAYVTDYLQYRLQIDAIDGFFGGNIIYSREVNNGRWIGRFRYIHNSSHLVDGHWNSVTNKWINNIKPTAFGNNYADILLARELGFYKYAFRYYGGMSLSTGMDTKTKLLKRFSYKSGFEFAIKNFFGNFLNRNENIFFAVNVDLKGIPKYILNQHYVAGIKLGNWDGKGFSFYFSYYNGGDIFNQYFQTRISRFGIGFTFDFI